MTFNTVSIFLLGIVTLSTLTSFILAASSNENIRFLHYFRQTYFFFKPQFYKFPLRWLSLLFVMLCSLFSKNHKYYLDAIFKSDYHSVSFDKEFKKKVASIRSYSYSLFIFRTVYYFLAIKNDFNKKKKMPYAFHGFLGTLRILFSGYTAAEYKIEELDRARYDLNKWLPKNKVLHFIDEEETRYGRYQHHLKMKADENKINEIKSILEDDISEIRDVKKRTTKRFDSAKGKGV